MYYSNAYLVVYEQIETGKKHLEIWSGLPQHKNYFSPGEAVFCVLYISEVKHEEFENKFGDASRKMLQELESLSKRSVFFKDVLFYLGRDRKDTNHKYSEKFIKFMRIENV